MKRSTLLWGLLMGLCLVGGALLLFFCLLPYATVRALADSLAADGSFDSLNPARFAQLFGPGLTLGVLLLLVSALLAVFRRPARNGIERGLVGLGRFGRGLPADFRELMRVLRPQEGEGAWLVALALISGLAVLARLLWLSKPMVHDEAYTFMAFASRSWRTVISDYHLPNNHIFHTVLVKLSTAVFGMQPWAVRLPACVAGILCVPFTYLLGRRLYGRAAGLLAAGMAAFIPEAILYSVVARGYSLFMLFTLLVIGLAIYLNDFPCNRVAWLLLSLFGALGLYTLPMMVYPLGIALVWLALASGRPLFGRILAVGAGSVLLGGLLYSPVVLVGTGLRSLTGNSFVSRLGWSDFFQTFVVRVRDTWGEWTFDLPLAVGLLLALGFLLSLFFHRWASRVRVPLQGAALLWLAPVWLLQRPNLAARFWTYLIPLFYIWSAGGLLWAAGRLTPERLRGRVTAWVAIVGLLALGGLALVRTHGAFPAFQPGPGEIEQVVESLQPELRPGDVLAVSVEDGPPFWYYLRLHGLSEKIAQRLPETTFSRVWVLVRPGLGQTPTSVLAENKVGAGQIDPTKCSPMPQLAGMDAYLCPAVQ